MIPRLPRRITAVIGTLAVSTALVACSAAQDSATGSKGYIAGDGEIVLIAEDEREAAPRLAGEAVGGGQVDSGDFAGSPYVINVWAAWCAPCRAEADDLVRASQRLDGVGFLGINTRDDQSAAEAFVRNHEIPYESLVDENGSELLSFYGLFNPKTLPTTLVVDSQGRIAALVTGPITETTLVDLVSDVTGEA